LSQYGLKPGCIGGEVILAPFPIITIGFSESNDVKAALRLGANGFIKKPYTMDILSRAVRKALQS